MELQKNVQYVDDFIDRLFGNGNPSIQDLRLLYAPPIEIRNDIDRYSSLIDIRKRRDQKEDISKIYWCNVDEVSLYGKDITDRTIVLLGSINLSGRRDMYKSLRYILGNAVFVKASMDTFYQLLEIGGNANFDNSFIQSLGSLERIGGDLSLNNSNVKDLGNLESVGGNIFYSQLRDKKLRHQIRELQK